MQDFKPSNTGVPATSRAAAEIENLSRRKAIAKVTPGPPAATPASVAPEAARAGARTPDRRVGRVAVPEQAAPSVTSAGHSLSGRLIDTALHMLHAAERALRPDNARHVDPQADPAVAREWLRECGSVLDLARHAPAEPPLSASIATEPGVQGLSPACAVGMVGNVDPAPTLEIYLLSPFRVFANDRSIDAWPNCKGKAIFKYLATHRGQPVPREVLMDVFWPDADPDAARNNLNVAIYGLRKALARADADFAFVLFRQGCYSFNPDLRIWVDAEALVDRIHRAQAAEASGHQDQAIAHYQVAQSIYHCALLVDDRYEDWLIPQRQSLQDSYLRLLERLAALYLERNDPQACASAIARTLEVEPCNEAAHRLLMTCYSRMGQVHLALRQYHFCVDALSRELKLIPSPQTVALFQRIRQRQPT